MRRGNLCWLKMRLLQAKIIETSCFVLAGSRRGCTVAMPGPTFFMKSCHTSALKLPVWQMERNGLHFVRNDRINSQAADIFISPGKTGKYLSAAYQPESVFGGPQCPLHLQLPLFLINCCRLEATSL
jgi:hypothetical protein